MEVIKALLCRWGRRRRHQLDSAGAPPPRTSTHLFVQTSARADASCIINGGETLANWLDVQSRHLVERVQPEPFWLDRPSFTDELVGREPLQGFEPTTE